MPKSKVSLIDELVNSKLPYICLYLPNALLEKYNEKKNNNQIINKNEKLDKKDIDEMETKKEKFDQKDNDEMLQRIENLEKKVWQMELMAIFLVIFSLILFFK